MNFYSSIPNNIQIQCPMLKALTLVWNEIYYSVMHTCNASIGCNLHTNCYLILLSPMKSQPPTNWTEQRKDFTKSFIMFITVQSIVSFGMKCSNKYIIICFLLRWSNYIIKGMQLPSVDGCSRIWHVENREMVNIVYIERRVNWSILDTTGVDASSFSYFNPLAESIIPEHTARSA